MTDVTCNGATNLNKEIRNVLGCAAILEACGAGDGEDGCDQVDMLLALHEISSSLVVSALPAEAESGAALKAAPGKAGGAA